MKIMETTRVKVQNEELNRVALRRKLENRSYQLELEIRHIKEMLEMNETKRIEMNRRMNRPGQNVDKMA